MYQIRGRYMTRLAYPMETRYEHAFFELLPIFYDDQSPNLSSKVKRLKVDIKYIGSTHGM
jgi:hypothetical protein